MDQLVQSAIAKRTRTVGHYSISWGSQPGALLAIADSCLMKRDNVGMLSDSEERRHFCKEVLSLLS